MSNIKEPVLSIIIPVYNVETYLRECLDSVINQVFEGIEIICVNDGSTDNSLSILNEYENKYSYIKVISQKNGGLSDARNTGIDIAKGKYICFLDSDDFLINDTYKKMIDVAANNDSDIVICGFNYYWGNDDKRNYYMEGLNKKYPELDNSKRAIISSMFAWNKIFKRSFFNEYGKKFVVGTLYEDIEIISYLFAKANRIDYIDEALINYRQRETSIMGTKSSRCKELFAVLERTYKKFAENKLIDMYKNEIEYLFVEQLLIYGQFRFLAMDNYKELVEESYLLVKEYFPNYLFNKYLQDQSLKYRSLVMLNNRLTASLFRIYLLRNEK